MAKREINIELRAAGGSRVAGEFGKIGKATSDLIVNVKKIGNVFGKLGGNIGGLLQNILKGGVFGVVQSVISLGISLIGKWRDSVKEAAEASKRATEEMIAANTKLIASIKEAGDAQIKACENALARREKEIDKVKELTKAEIELQRQREIAAAKGDEGGISAANSKADRMLSEVDLEAAARKIEERMAAAQEEVLHRRATADMMHVALENAEAMSNQLRRNYLTAEDAAARNAVAREETKRAADALRRGVMYSMSDEDRTGIAAAARESFAESEEGKALAKEVKEHADKLADAKKAAENADMAVDAAKLAIKDIEDSAELLAKKMEVSIATSANNAASALRKAEQDAAKERENLDRENHQKRMAQLRDEIAEQQKAIVKQREAATPLRAVASAAKSEFDRAFAMFRDPERAAAEIGEEKAYQSDLTRLHKSAQRYGGKWRIDELSRLMAAGDSQGVADTLAQWRKSRGFTPEVESMVRASAAERAKTTAEEELRKIEANTAGLAEKIDELLSMKGT